MTCGDPFITVARMTSSSDSRVIEGFELPIVGICHTSSFNSIMVTVLGSEWGGYQGELSGLGSVRSGSIQSVQFSSIHVLLIGTAHFQ